MEQQCVLIHTISWSDVRGLYTYIWVLFYYWSGLLKADTTLRPLGNDPVFPTGHPPLAVVGLSLVWCLKTSVWPQVWCHFRPRTQCTVTLTKYLFTCKNCSPLSRAQFFIAGLEKKPLSTLNTFPADGHSEREFDLLLVTTQRKNIRLCCSPICS